MKRSLRVGVALGSNMGDRLANLRAGLRWLEKISEGTVLVSRVYETEPVDCPNGSAAFLNAVCEMGYGGEITELLRRTQSFEQECGRSKFRARHAPRPLDMDLLYADDLVLNNPELILPHPRMCERSFVLQPLCDIRPDLVLPGQTCAVRELLASLRNQARVGIFHETLK